MATGSTHQSTRKVHEHWLIVALPQPFGQTIQIVDKRYTLWTNDTDCGQTIQTVDKRYRLFIHHYDPEECNKLRSAFLNLDYPINSAINKLLHNIDSIVAAKNTRDDSPTITVSLPFKDQ